MAQLETSTFARLAPRISLYSPETPSSGQLVVVCTWLGASLKHISKYLTLYKRVAPGAKILLIQSDVSILTSRYPKQRAAIQPAVTVVLAALAETDRNVSSSARSPGDSVEQPKILLHCFSNGGTNTATQLLIEVRKRLEASLPLVGLVFDSCPAKGTYWKSYDAMLLSLPRHPMFRILGPLICHGILIILYAWIACGNENPASLQRRTMVDENTVQSSSGRPARACYIYSEADRMCDWHDITDHAEYVRAKGWEVREVVVDGSGHCAHMTKDEVTYASAIDEIWGGKTSDEWRTGKLMAKM